MRFLILVLALTVSLNSVKAYTFQEFTGSSAEYDLSNDQLVLNIEHFPANKKTGKYIISKNKTLKITFTNVSENIVSTRLKTNFNHISGLIMNPDKDASTVLESTKSVNFKENSSTHKIAVSGLRGTGSLSTLSLELLDGANEIIDTKIIRLNYFSHLPGGSSANGCAPVLRCGEYKFPDEEISYTYQECGVDGSTLVDVELCNSEESSE
jgi:hypothetical protein